MDRRCSLGRLYDAHVSNALDALAHELQSVGLTVLVSRLIADSVANGKSVMSAPTYEQGVRTLCGARFLSHELMPARVKRWIAGMADVASGTRCNRVMALRSFVAYCVAIRARPTTRASRPRSVEQESCEHAIQSGGRR